MKPLRRDISPLPVKNGVSPNCLYLPKGEWRTVYEYFLDRFSHLSPSQLASRFENKEVVTRNGEILSELSQYKSDQHIYFYRELAHEITIPFEEKIIYEDENILVADKPHFLPVAPTGQYLQETLIVRLRRKLNNDSLELCHRLDRETAGVVLLTKKPQLRGQYHRLFSERLIKKTYHALVKAKETDFPIIHKSRLIKGEPFFRMKEVLGNSNSETFIELLEKRDAFNLVRLIPVSGKKHQLRVHLAALDMPIVNDIFYPVLEEKKMPVFANPLQLLAKSLEFTDPISKVSKRFESGFSL